MLDQTQTPNTKVKIATLKYMRQLVEGMEPNTFAPADDNLPLAVTKVTRCTTLPGPLCMFCPAARLWKECCGVSDPRR